MRQAIETKLAKTDAALSGINHAGWTESHTWTPAFAAAVAEKAEALVETAERCRRVLSRRYGVAV
jgi:hypothetical protein